MGWILIISLSLPADLLAGEEKCPHCGEAIEANSAFCPFCGKQIGEIRKREAAPDSEKTLEQAGKSTLSVAAFHNRTVYDAWGEKTPITYLLGTAFVIRKGYAVTDLSVVENAREVRLLNSEGKPVGSEIIGKDHLFGIAVLKIHDENLPPLPKGNSDQLKIGNQAFAVGYPAAKGEAKVGIAIGKGIISALNRSGMGLRQYESFIQTDTPFTDGMNGAPMLNRAGELIGMTAMFMYPWGIYDKLATTVGFASPINEIYEAAMDIIEGKTRERGWIGIIPDELKNHPDKEVRKGEKGLYVRFVEKNSPAEASSIKRGDILLAVDGKEIEEIHKLQKLIVDIVPGKEVELRLKNKEGVRSVRLTLQKRKDRIRLLPQDMIRCHSGISFQENEKGLLTVQQVEPGSEAFKNDVKFGYTLDDIFVKKDFRSDRDDFDFFNIRSWKDLEKVVDRGYSDWDFWVVLRFKEKDKRGERLKLVVWGILQEFSSI